MVKFCFSRNQTTLIPILFLIFKFWNIRQRHGDPILLNLNDYKFDLNLIPLYLCSFCGKSATRTVYAKQLLSLFNIFRRKHFPARTDGILRYPLPLMGLNLLILISK